MTADLSGIPRIAIVGAGAIGLAYASLLAPAANVVVLARGQTAAAFRNGRAVITTAAIDVGLGTPDSFRVTESWGDLLADYALICVKAPQTRWVAAQLASVGFQGLVVSIQNGIGNREALQESFPETQILAGATYMASSRSAPGVVHIVAVGDTVIEAPAETQRIEALASAFRRSRLPLALVSDLTVLLWNKLAVAVGTNAVTALCHVRLGALASGGDHSSLARVAALAIAECMAIMKRKGIAVVEDPWLRVQGLAGSSAGNLSSMLQDVMAGRETEIEMLNGVVVEEGRRLGVPTPVNEVLTLLLRGTHEAGGWRIDRTDVMEG